MKKKGPKRQGRSKKVGALEDLKPKRAADVKGGARMMTKSATMGVVISPK